VSKLPGDIKRRKAAAETATRTLECDLREKAFERIIPYSDKHFRRSAVEWLVATDQVRISFYKLILIFHSISSQPLYALEHPKFKELIDVASRATNGVNIPHQKRTRAEIMRMLKDHLTNLKAQLNVRVLMVPYLNCLTFFIFAGSYGSRRS